MANESVPVDNTVEILWQDPMLRREAGEGWHENGFNPHVFGSIVAREIFLNRIVEAGQSSGKVLRKEYLEQSMLTHELKTRAGLGSPPLLPNKNDPI